MKHTLRLISVAVAAMLCVTTLAVVPVEAKGRYKQEGKRCVWDPNDSGPNQCTPPKGRYKRAGDRCVWEANDTGPDQCTPAKGRFKKEGDRCVWDANDSGPDQCRPGA